MSTQQALGVVGGVVGMFFGYPQLGFVVGSLVGGLLTPKEKIEGPRVEDLKVQVSTYGAGIPVVYGNARVGGNVIWSTDKIETETTEDVGKGGGAESTTYRYFVHMRIRLCETPANGESVSIRKIWQDGKLIYDASFGMPIMSAIASAENPHAFLVLYQGYEDQLPDPIEEQFLGIGNVPAYRGGVDVRMNAVECPGGRVPQFSFEVCVGAGTVATNEVFTTFPGAPSLYTSIIGSESLAHVATLRQGGDNYSFAYELRPGSVVTLSSSRTTFASPSNYLPMVAATGSGNRPTSVFSMYMPGDLIRYGALDHQSGIELDLYLEDYDDGRGHIQAACYDEVYDAYALNVDGTNRMLVLPQNLYSPLVPGSVRARCYRDRVLTEIYWTVPGEARLIQQRINPDQSWTTLADVAVGTFGTDALFLLMPSLMGIYLRIVHSGMGLLRFVRYDGAFTVLSEQATTRFPAAFESTFFCNDHYAIVGPFDIAGTPRFEMIRHAVISPNPASVAYIISDQCRRAGLLPEQFTTAGLDEWIHGYTLANPASARSNLQPLMTAFAIDATEEDGKLKFFKRSSKESVATILYEELGAVEGDSEAGDPMPLTRAQDAELPRSVSASYTNKDFDYQTGTEKAIRQIFDSQNDMMVDLAMSTTSDHAATVAQAILYDSHSDRNKRSLKVSRKYAFLSAGDVVTVEYPATILSQWRIVQITDTGALIEIECVPFDAAIYTQTAVGATGYSGQTVAPLPPPTRLQILDIPILRDQDNNAGLYTAMAGFGDGWPGAALQTWDDPGTIENRGTVEREAPIGFVESALGNWTSGIVDESNLLTVNVGLSELNSISYDALLYGTSNVAAVGAAGRWEVIKFRNADSLGDGRYILSGLMRGQRGTEWARGTHTGGDAFVLLSMAGMLRPNFDAGSIGQTKTYRAVTKGRSPASASTQTYANTAEGLETFSPTNLDKSISGGDITLSVVRRTRLSENWLRGIVPLGEDAERFEFELFTDGTFATVRRVIASSTRSAIYTAAMQSADGYTSGPLYVRVYQLSGVVGRGHALQETI